MDSQSRHEFEKAVQAFFTDGLVTVVGSGLSAAEGISGMPSLAKYLQAEIVADELDSQSAATWTSISEQLANGEDLETCLHDTPPTPSLEKEIIDKTASLITKDELNVIAEVITGKRRLRFSRLLDLYLKTSEPISVITTNYDRLIELACEYHGVAVDTFSIGQQIGGFDAEQSKWMRCRGYKQASKGRIRFRFANSVSLCKPHGSLDWYQVGGQPIRCAFPIQARRLMITPGNNKYRAGYERPFDLHREKANAALDLATRLLFIGYGFNDPHLETHVESRITEGAQSLILTRDLSEYALRLVKNNTNIIAVSQSDNQEDTLVHFRGSEYVIKGETLWDLDGLIDGVF